MIRGNLATRPFYAERLIHRWLGIATVLVLALTAYNAVQLVYYSHSDADLQAQANADNTRAAELRRRAATLQESQDAHLARLTEAAAVEANQIIAHRTFSWTALLNAFEAALPHNARITAVRPAEQARRGRLIVMTVVGRSVEAVDTFLEDLERTGAFANALSRNEQVNEAGDIEAAIEVEYLPTVAAKMRP